MIGNERREYDDWKYTTIGGKDQHDAISGQMWKGKCGCKLVQNECGYYTKKKGTSGLV